MSNLKSSSFFKDKMIKKLVLTILSFLTMVSGIVSLLLKIPTNAGDGTTVSIIGNMAFTAAATYTQGICTGIVAVTLVMVVINLISLLLLWIKNKKYSLMLFSNSILPVVLISLAGFVSLKQTLFFIVEGVLIVIGLITLIYGLIANSAQKEEDSSEAIKDAGVDPVKLKRNMRATLVFDVISIVSLLLIFFIPVYSYVEADEAHTLLLIQGFTGTDDVKVFVSFLVSFLLFIGAIALFFESLKYYWHVSKGFSDSVSKSIYYNFVIAIVFFIAGQVFAFYYKTKGYTASSLSYIPLAVEALLTFILGFFNSKNNITPKVFDNRKVFGKYRLLMLVFVILFTALTLSTIYLFDLVQVKLISYNGSVIYTSKISGKELLDKAAEAGGNYQLVAFIVQITQTICIICIVLSAAAFFFKSDEYKRITLVSIVINFIFTFALGIFGKYFKISLLIDNIAVNEYLNTFVPGGGIDINSWVDFEVESPAFTAVIIGTLLMVVLIVLKPFTRTDDLGMAKDIDVSTSGPLDINIVNGSVGADGTIDNTPEPDTSVYETFDACPAFSELDGREAEFNEALENRRAHLFETPTLPELIKFVVDYARESKLHLSYSLEDIADFVAGLGATKLTILQGMSGTGKTSLPKIFCEALMGSVEIIEVESSWKDKNELLGYYNEFSKAFTPKKFTQALYKASLNKDVVTLIVLDEMNLSRIEYYFSDFLSLMENEPENREIKLLNVKLYNTHHNERHSYKALKNNHTLHIPENVWFIGTANRDESTFEISDKVYDRAHTMNFNKRAPKVKNFSTPIDKRFLTYDDFYYLLTDPISKYDFDLEAVEAVKKAEEFLRPYNISFGNRIMNQIEAYVKIYCSCFTNSKDVEAEALEKILLSKVVTKLEFKAVENKEELADQFDSINFHMCSEFIRGLNEDF